MFPSIYSGKPIYAKDLQDLMSEVKSARITSVVGGSFTRGIHGTCITIKQSNGAAGGGAITEKLPFQIFESPDPQDPEDPEPPRPLFEVNPVSYIWKSIGSIERVIVTPFNTPGQYPKFFLPKIPAAIVVTITFDEKMAIVDAILEQIPLEEWPENAGGYPWPIERDLESEGPDYLRQKKLYIVIAEISYPEDGRAGTVVTDQNVQKKIIQIVKSHLMLDWQILDGMAAKVAIPWSDQPQLVYDPDAPNP